MEAAFAGVALAVILDATALRPCAFEPPVSKSDAHRALVLGSLTGHPVTVAHPPTDVQVMANGLCSLGKTIDCVDAGAPFRILLALAALTPGRTVFTGTPRLGERPRQPLVDALRATLDGVDIREGSPWPIECVGTAATREPRFRVNAARSSQFATALLLACAALHRREGRPWHLELEGSLASPGYLALTERWLRGAGFGVETSPGRVSVLSWTRPGAFPAIPADWSSAAYLLLAAWRSGGTVEGLDATAEHPDRAIVPLLASVGVSVRDGAVSGAARGGFQATAAESPDLAPTLAALACALPAPSEIRSVSVLREKESDRLAGIQRLVGAAGGETTLQGDSLTIRPPRRIAPALQIDSQGDHRMAMSAAVLACLGGSKLTVSRPECVAKSFPGFWSELAKAGCRIEE